MHRRSFLFSVAATFGAATLAPLTLVNTAVFAQPITAEVTQVSFTWLDDLIKKYFTYLDKDSLIYPASQYEKMQKENEYIGRMIAKYIQDDNLDMNDTPFAPVLLDNKIPNDLSDSMTKYFNEYNIFFKERF